MSEEMTQCPFCDGRLEAHQHVKYHWRGTTPYAIALSHMECPDCGSYITTPEQSRRNKQTILVMKQTRMARSHENP